MKERVPQQYFTKREAAEYLRCSLRSVDNFIARQELRAYKLTAKKLLFAREDLDKFARRHVANVDLDVVVNQIVSELGWEQVNTEAFLRAAYGKDAPGDLVLWTRQDRHSSWSLATNLTAVVPIAKRLATSRDVYFGVALQDKKSAHEKWRAENPNKPGEPTTRGYSATAIALPGLWADIDMRSVAHVATNLPPTKDAARALVREFPLSPTVVIDSGHGLQVWWLFSALWIFNGEAERCAAQSLARQFLGTLQALATAHGWRIDPTSDLARLMRVPGTWNRKLQPVPVRILEFHEQCRYHLSDFERYLIRAQSVERPSQVKWHGRTGAVAPALHYCRFLQHCRDGALTISEPEWYAMVSNLARLRDGREAIHALSQPYPRYSPAETDQKIAHALTAHGPHTCQFIQQSLGFGGCPPAGCGVKSPAGLAVSARAQQLLDAREQHRAAVERARAKRAAAIALAQDLLTKQGISQTVKHEHD